MENIEEIVQRLDLENENNFKNEIHKYIKKWYWFVLFGSIGFIVSFFIFKNSPYTYVVNSRVLVQIQNEEINSVLSFDDNSANSANRNMGIDNKIAILKSYSLFNRALQNLNWTTTWYQKELLFNKELYPNKPFEILIPHDAKNARGVEIEITALSEKEYHLLVKGEGYINGHSKNIDIDEVIQFGVPFVNDVFNFTLKPGNGTVGVTYELKFNNLSSLTNYYLGKTDISIYNQNSNLINISITGTNRQKEADFINELNRVFIQYGLENRNSSSEKSVEFIDSQISRIKSSLGSAEETYSAYRRNNNVMNMGQEAQMVSTQLKNIEQEQYLNQLQLDYYNNLLKYLDDSKKIEEIVNPSVVGITNSNLDNLLTNLRTLYGRKEVLSYSVRDKNPAFVLVEKEISIARDGLETMVKNQLNTAKDNKESLQERYNIVQSRLKKLPETEKRMIGIQRELNLNSELYTYLMQKRAEASISQASIAPEVKVLDDAMVETAKFVGPNLVRMVGVGVLGGLFIPFLTITLLSLLNSKIEKRDEIERYSQIPVFEGIIKHKYKDNLPVVKHPRSGIAESFRGLKSNLIALFDNPKCIVVAINSLIPGEGKSFIASNFSVILAKSNKKVLLIGADLFKPTLHKYFMLMETDGLGSFLKGEKEFEEIIINTNIPNLNFIQGGAIHQDPSDLTDTPRFEQLIETARNLYDYIIIDNPPLMLIPDTILSSRFSDISLFILRINFSHKDQIKQINRIVNFNKIQKSAIVINEVPGRDYGYGKKYWVKGYGEHKYKSNGS